MEIHYSFNKKSPRISTKELGETSVEMLIINVVIPFLLCMEKSKTKNT
ncbi:MAG: DUF2851 family protein [Draconibacterium sp.]|nr:DUF2851 family protein [Draconibacterium sp.]